MAKKKINPLEDPPTASSSDEEEVETLSGEEEEGVEEEISDDSSSEEEDELMSPVNIPAGKKPKPPSAAVTIAVPGRLSVASGSESSPSKPGSKKAVAVTTVKPTEKEDRGSPAVKSGKKRPDEKTSTEVSAKRAKVVSEEGEKKIVEDTKKPLFQRLWSQEDEISLLQGMIEFEADKGYSPYDDMDGLYELAMKSISFEASKNQFMDKIRGLKKKYMGKMKKGVESFSKGHDYECLKLAKCIWGSDGMALESAVKSNVKKSEKKMDSLKPHGKDVEEVESDGMALESAVKSNVKKSEKKMDSLKPLGQEVEYDGMALESAVKSNVKKSEKKMDSLKPHGKDVEEVESDGMALESAVKSNVKKSEKKMDSLKPLGKEVEYDGMALESAVKSNVKKSEKKMDSLKPHGKEVESAVKFIVKKSEKKIDSLRPHGKEVESDVMAFESSLNGEKVEEDREVLVNNGKKVEEDKEVLIHGGDSSSLGPRASDWFVRSIASLGVDEQFVTQKWSMVAAETKTRMEEKWKLLQAKEMEIVLQKIDFMREVGSVIAEAS